MRGLVLLLLTPMLVDVGGVQIGVRQYPDLTLFCYFLGSVNATATGHADPRRVLEGHGYGLLPAFIDGSTMIAGIPVDYQRLCVVGMGVLTVAGLWLFTHYTRIGLALRGMAQDERAAMMLGTDSDLMALMAIGLGSMLAALAAILLLPPCYIVVESGYNVLILAIAVCIVGGLGSWAGAVLAAFLIGFAQILTVVYLGTHFQMVVALLAIILTLILNPSGIFGRQKKLEERV